MINRMVSIPNELDTLLKTERNASQLITTQMLRYYAEQGVTADALKGLSVKLELIEKEKQETQTKLEAKRKETAEADALKAEQEAKNAITIDAELQQEKTARLRIARLKIAYNKLMNGKNYTWEDFKKWEQTQP